MEAENKPLLESAKFEFTQEAHCMSDNSIESIEIEFLSDMGVDQGKGGYFVIKTEQWAVNDEKDLKELFDRISSIIKKS